MTVSWDVLRTILDVERAASQGVALGAESVLSTAIDHIMNDPKTGRIYRRRGVEHQASAPGEAPASDTGTLVRRSTTEHDAGALVSTVFFRTAYAAALEYGTAKIAPRPYARVSLEEKREEIEQNIKDRVSAVLQRAGG
jgi:hypothetical protein